MKVVAASDGSALSGLMRAGWTVAPEVAAEVSQILAEVRERGDVAVATYTRRFDDPSFELSKLRVAVPMLDAARALIPREVAAALELAKERITRFHDHQRLPDVAYVEEDGTRYAMRRCALRSAAVYAARRAAGVAVLMGAVPARMAGVGRIVVLSPPAADGVSAAALFASALVGVDELYAVGGAQAIGSAAFGTEVIRPVDAIVGCGGVWTSEAKRQIFGTCGVDVPSNAEVVVVADDRASSEYVVGELLAQAELPGSTRLAAISESRPLLEAVAQLLDTLDLRSLERHELVSEAIAGRCRLIHVVSREELLEVVNRIAPAYLCLQVRNASEYLDGIHAAGTVFVGDLTPLVSGEYLGGTNAIVPASGTARFASGVSLADFTRSYSVVENSAERMTNDASALATLADYDGLPHHAQTARMRCGS